MTLIDATTETAIGPAAPSDEELLERFRPVFAQIAEGAVEREQGRQLPFDAIGLLRDAGFGTLRIPREHGGLGATPRQLFRLLIELGEADSNLPQALRGHFAFVEGRLRSSDEASRSEWFERIVGGALVGNSQAERGAETGTTAQLTADGDGWRITGQKYYTTGTIFSDWTITSAKRGDEHVSVLVRTTADGVTASDDWDGFGQRMTGSGTTRFDNAWVEPGHVFSHDPDEERSHASVTAFFQLVLLSALSGIARAVLRDAVAFVRPRTRTFGVSGASSPREDPLVQRVVGKLSSLAFSAEELTLAAAARLDAVDEARLAGIPHNELHTAAQLAAFRAQQVVLPTVLDATTLLFEVGGASATAESRRLDRHWRNARTIAAHNPAIYRERLLGDFELNDALPLTWWATPTPAG